MRRQRLSA